jgi:hypothetical protein
MPNEQTLKDHVAKTAAEAAAAHAKIRGLEIQVTDWNAAIAKATADRERYALPGLSGDASAAAATKKAIAEQREAEQNLETLALALPAARVELDNAERAAAAARHALAMMQAGKLMHQRVDVSGRMDVKFAELQALHIEWTTLGKQLQSFPGLDLSQGGSMARWEECIGTKRLAGAAPVFLTKLGAADPSQRAPLAVSEARFWSLPAPEQPAKAA